MALALRVLSLGAGLPGAGLLWPDEDSVVPHALSMLQRGSPNPGWFLYPSLYLGVLAGVLGLVGLVVAGPAGVPFGSKAAYALDPTPYIMTGRAISVVAGLGLVLATLALGRRAYGPSVGIAAAAVVAVAPLAVTYSRLAVTDMAMTATFTAGLWLLLVALEERSRKRLLWAAIVIGLAASIKYNAGLGLVPLLGVALVIAGGQGRRRLERARATLAPAGLALAGFLAGTPFALLDPATFARDFIRQNRIVAQGWLGFENSGPGLVYNVKPVLWAALGAGLTVLAGVGLLWAAWRRTRADLLLGSFALLYFLYVSLWNAHFDRYLLPIVSILAVMGARLARDAARSGHRRVHSRRLVPVGVLLGVLLATTAWSSVGLVRGYARPDLRLAAARAIAYYVPRGATIAIDPLGPPLIDVREGDRLNRAGHHVPYFDLMRLRTPQPGLSPDPRRNLAALRRGQVRWAITSASIEDRVFAAASHYPLEARFYRALRRTARLVVRVPASLGPGVSLWDLSRRPPRGSPIRAGR